MGVDHLPAGFSGLLEDLLSKLNPLLGREHDQKVGCLAVDPGFVFEEKREVFADVCC